MTSSASVPGSIFSMTVLMPRLATPSASRALAPVPDRRLTSMSWVSASLAPGATSAAAVPSAPAVPAAWPLASCAFTRAASPACAAASWARLMKLTAIPFATPLGHRPHRLSIARRVMPDHYDVAVMPPRQTLPGDDLYARLGVPRDASAEAIDLAWRGLLRKHHPDIAGPDALELAKRINVAHDWLSDPELRRRYDREHADGIRSGRSPRASGRPDWSATAWRPVRRPPTTAERVTAVVERVGRLTRDELDRLSLAEPAPIAF